MFTWRPVKGSADDVTVHCALLLEVRNARIPDPCFLEIEWGSTTHRWPPQRKGERTNHRRPRIFLLQPPLGVLEVSTLSQIPGLAWNSWEFLYGYC